MEKIKVRKTSRQPPPTRIIMDHKLLEYVEYFNHLGSIKTKDASCTREIKSRIAMAKAAFNKKKTLHEQMELKFKEGNDTVLDLGHSFVRCCILDTSESRSEVPGKF